MRGARDRDDGASVVILARLLLRKAVLLVPGVERVRRAVRWLRTYWALVAHDVRCGCDQCEGSVGR